MAQVFYCVYDSDGAVTKTGRTDNSTTSLIDLDGGTLLVTTDEVFLGQDYVDVATETVLPMTHVTATATLSADTDEVVSLTGLPDCTVNYYLGDYVTPLIPTLEDTQEPIATDTVTDGQLDISADLAGVYTIMLSASTSLESIVTFTVEDS